jgi:hypothetical protein
MCECASECVYLENQIVLMENHHTTNDPHMLYTPTIAG